MKCKRKKMINKTSSLPPSFSSLLPSLYLPPPSPSSSSFLIDATSFIVFLN